MGGGSGAGTECDLRGRGKLAGISDTNWEVEV